MQQRALSSILVLLVPLSLGLRGCLDDDPVSLGKNEDGGTGSCDPTDCGAAPPFACPDGTSPYTCHLDESGTCRWRDEGCGEDAGAAVDAGVEDAGAVEACMVDDCGPVPELAPCSDGTLQVRCDHDEAGVCQWLPRACAGECAEGTCGDVPPTLPCGEGVEETITGRCVFDDAGECVWETRTCGCEPEDCDGAPPPIACADGSLPYACEPAADADGSCAWTRYPCPGDECTEGACGPIPPTLPCGQGVEQTLSGRCIANTEQVCEWEALPCACEPDECGEAPGTICGDESSPYACRREESLVCEWVDVGCP